MPIALNVFAEAAKDAGISTSGTTKELFKLMEDGLVPSAKIMPFVSKGFHTFAMRNDALGTIMKTLGKMFDVVNNGLMDFKEAIFKGGAEDGARSLVNAFADLLKSSKFLGSLLGGTVNGAIKGLLLPFRALYSIIFDVTEALGLQGDTTNTWVKNIAKVTAGVFGLIASLWALKKIGGILRATPRLFGMARGAAASGSVGAAASSVASGVQNVFVVNMGAGGMLGGSSTGTSSAVSRFASAVGKFVGMIPVIALAYNRITSDSPSATDRLMESQGFKMPTLSDVINDPLGNINSDKRGLDLSNFLRDYKPNFGISNKPTEVNIRVTADDSGFNAKIDKGIKDSYAGTYY